MTQRSAQRGYVLHRAKRALGMLGSLIAAFAVSVSVAEASYWNGHGYQYDYRLSGDNVLHYWYAPSAYINDYNKAMDGAINMWYYPRHNGTGATCKPDNGFNYYYSGSNDASEMDLITEFTTDLRYQGVPAFVTFHRWVQGGVEYLPNNGAYYDWTRVKFNRAIADARPLTAGFGSKRTIAAHELGHVLGLDHSSGSGTVMSPQDGGRDVIGPTCTDNDSVRQRW